MGWKNWKKTSRMQVVSDSDVIIHLAKLDKLTLIKGLYESAFIPEYVKSEIMRYQYDEAGIIEDGVRQGILKVHKTDESRARNIARRYGIHIGEAHAKELAEDLHAKIFLSNERKVRVVAKEEKFSVVGTIGIILRGANQGYLTKEEAVKLLNRLKASEFRIHPSIANHAIDSLKKWRQNEQSV